MPAPPSEYTAIYGAVREFFQRNGVELTDAEISQIVTSAMENWRNDPSNPPLIKNGEINQEFMKGVVQAATASSPGEGPPPPAPEETDDASKKAARRARRVRDLSFRAQIGSLGIAMTSNLEALIQEAAQKGYNREAFEYYLRQTPEFQDRFVGIFNPDGSLKMNTTQYMAAEQHYETYAAQAGVNMNDNLMGWLFTNNVTPGEFQERAPAVAQIQNNPAMYQQFQRALAQEGLIKKPGDVSKKEVLRFVMGEGNREWYNVWNLTRARYVATQAGLSLTKNAERYFALNPQMIERIAHLGLSDEALATGFAEISDNMVEFAGTNADNLLGVNKRTLVKAAFGGKGSIAARRKVGLVQKTREAFQEDRAAPSAYIDQTGSFRTGTGLQGKGGSY